MTQGRDKALDDKGRDKGMTQGYDARAALTGHMLRSLNWHAATYRQTHRHTDVPGSLYPGTKISFLVAREALVTHWLVFPGLTG